MSTSPLQQKSVMVIFTYAPAGLGHLRVTDALYHGLPDGVDPIILGSQDSFIRLAHRFTSIHPIARSLFEWAQHGALTEIFTYFYRLFLRTQTKNLYRQMITVTSQRIEFPQTVVVVATHYGMAQQIGAIKKKLMKALDIRIILVVQVTDDTPQHIWYVQGADLIFVPSEQTKKLMIQYGHNAHLQSSPFEVNPYPISPVLTEKLSDIQFENRKHQLDPSNNSQLHITIPISGAAVGTGYMSTLIEELHLSSPRFLFHVVAKTAPFTDQFMYKMTRHSYVDLITSAHDRTIVDAYEQLYKKHIIGIEITKPSEQAFKTLAEPRQRGGSVILLAEPVGQQEYDNMAFLRRHHLIPWASTLHQLYHCAENNIKLDGDLKHFTHSHARRWRAVTLPTDPQKAAQFITWCYNEGVFYEMALFDKAAYLKHSDYNHHEIGSNGVELFWQKVSHLL